MSTELAPQPNSSDRYGFNEEQIRTIKATIAPGASNDELALFLNVAQKTGLDPFTRQIYLAERRAFNDQTGQWTVKKTPETTIDGFRVIAERSGVYAGQIGPFWCGPEGNWQDVWLHPTPPSAARVGILRHDFKEPVWGVALYSEYVQTKKDGTPNSMWKKMAANQLAKCAESLGLRKAFPRDLSGMYTKEEMPDPKVEAEDAQAGVLKRKLEMIEESKRLAAAPPEVIMEMNEILDQPPQVEVVEPPKKSIRKRGTVSFEALKNFGEIKKELEQYTGNHEAYYNLLRTRGYSHADEIKDNNEAREIWKAMALFAKQAKDRLQMMESLGEIETVIGKRFMEILGTHGCENKEQALELTGEATQALLKDLHEATKPHIPF